MRKGCFCGRLGCVLYCALVARETMESSRGGRVPIGMFDLLLDSLVLSWPSCLGLFVVTR